MPAVATHHHRRSIRLPGYDYTRPGAYFVTLVTYGRECLFGEIVGGEMVLSDHGAVARAEWFITAETRTNVVMHPDEMVLMPNHLHGIIRIIDTRDRTTIVGAQRRCAPTTENYTPPDHASLDNAISQGINVASGSLGAIIRAYKSAVTKRINLMRNTPGSPVWQRNYYENIIRDDNEQALIRLYIDANPANWQIDQENR
jgi:putative transposase